MGKKKSTDSESDMTNEPEAIQNQPKVLIIDDEKALRQSVKRILERAGFYCETAMDYSSAKKCVENLEFDLILADIVLPKMNGITLISKLQEEIEFNSAIIFLTGEPNLETCTQAIRIGALDYLEKPVTRAALIESIKRVMLKRKNAISIQGKSIPKTLTLNPSFLDTDAVAIDDEAAEEMRLNVEKIHSALLDLKKKYGGDFSEIQRSLLNQIAQSNSAMKKLLKKSDDL